jgi:hypothetical protein
MESVVKRILVIWLVLLAITTSLMLLLLLTNHQTSLTISIAIFWIAIRFIAGFGFTMGICSMVIFILTKFGRLFEGEKNQGNLKRFLIFIIIVFIIIVIYQGPYKIYTAITNPTSTDNIFDLILYVYGIASLFVNVYILPLWKKKFFVMQTITEKEVLKKSVKESINGLRTRFLSWRKRYLDLELQKQFNLKERFNEIRRNLAIFILIFLGIGCMVFTPICAIGIYLVYITTRPLKFEAYLLMISCIVIMTISILLPFLPLFADFYTVFKTYALGIYIAQFIGYLIASLIYILQLIKPMLEERKKQQMKDLKKKSEDLKKERDELQKAHDDLMKEKKKLEKQVKKKA